VRASLSGFLGPTWSGFLGGFGTVALLGAVLGKLANHYSVPDPSPELFDHLAQVGVGVLVAFAVTLASVGVKSTSRDDHINWMSYGCGLAIAGFIGIALCVALSTQAAAGVGRTVDLNGLAWASTTIGMLGIVVCLGPLMIFQSRRDIADES
jgi:hypothetical protein